MPTNKRLAPLLFLGGLLLAGSVSAYEAGPVDNGGTIEGKVVFTGQVPMKKVIPDDPETCGSPRDEAQVVVGNDKGVKDAVVYLEGIESGKPWPERSEPPSLNNQDCAFVPQMLAMRPGTLVVTNFDPVFHNTHGFYGRRTAFNVALPRKDMEVEQELRRPGIVRVECDEHGHMHARILVASNPYHHVTAEDGAFSLEDVPPGTYTLVAYQRTTGPKEFEVEVEAGKTTRIDIDLAQ